jgi:hypothetical protein
MFEKKAGYLSLALALLFFPGCPAVELYDLDADSQERVNLASSRDDLAKRMVRKIREIYGKQRKAAKNQVQPDEKLEEQLRALGYIP